VAGTEKLDYLKDRVFSKGFTSDVGDVTPD
jgi:hypothetical protein